MPRQIASQAGVEFLKKNSCNRLSRGTALQLKPDFAGRNSAESGQERVSGRRGLTGVLWTVAWEA